MIFNLFTTAKVAAYPNEEAHNEIRAIMARSERISTYFSVDKNGIFIANIETKTTEKFVYQLNDGSFKWLLGYLKSGESDDTGVDPKTPRKFEGMTPDALRTELLKGFIEKKVGIIKTVPAFRDRPGRLTAHANLKYGIVGFYTERNSDLEDFMREHKLIG